HPDDIWALSWTATNHLVSGCADGHLRIFDAAELAAPVYDIPSNPLAVTSVSCSRDGKRALASSLDGSVVLVDTSEGRILGKVETGREKAASGEQELPAFTSALHPDIKCWAWSGRSSKVGIRPIMEEEASNDEELDGSAAVGRGPLGGEGGVIDTGKGKFTMSLNFSPDGRSLALSTEIGHIVVVDTETQNVVASYQSHAMAVRTVAWSPDSQWLYSGGDDHRIVLHDVRAGSKTGAGGRGEGAVANMQGHQSWILNVAASPDGKLLGSGSADSTVKLWDVGTRSCVSTSSTAGAVWAVEWQPEGAGTLAPGKQFAVAGDERAVTLYRAAGAV
ncbi:hypothetical protein JCM24511_02417, partial [Saitozyma sp. JCM 24511]